MNVVCRQIGPENHFVFFQDIIFRTDLHRRGSTFESNFDISLGFLPGMQLLHHAAEILPYRSLVVIVGDQPLQ